MKKIIAVLGGKNEKTFLEAGERHDVEVMFCQPFKKSPIRSQLLKVIKSAHSVVIIGGCCSHKDMLEAKKIAKKLSKPFVVERSQGATNAIQKGLQLIDGLA
jgi:hypothetical protein